MTSQRIASLSLDLDNKWSYLKTAGDAKWDTFPSYFDLVVPRFLELLEQLDLKISVFVVGQDAALESNRAALQLVVERGHEIANHSFHHEPWLHQYDTKRLDQEFETSEAAIKNATGIQPIGFRGPGFSYSDRVLETLIQRGYLYDCTTFPTYIGPLARAYYFFRSSLSKDEQQDRKALFGNWTDGFQSNRPFQWYGRAGSLVEIPVSTFPIFKTPVHLSYILFLSRYSTLLAKTYFNGFISACKAFRIAPSLLLHPLDFLGYDDEPELAFFPAMDLTSNKKVAVVRWVLETLKRSFKVVTMQQHATIVGSRLTKRSIATAPNGAV